MGEGRRDEATQARQTGFAGNLKNLKMSNFSVCLPLVLLVLQVSAGKKEIPSPGSGYPGSVVPYQSPASLQADMSRFGMSAWWFRRNGLPDEYTRLQTPQINELPYLLYAPKRSTKPVPMVVYFGGTGEQGTDLSAHFRQTTLFERLTDPEFQKLHPCYVFAPMLPADAVIRAALPGERSMMADLVCDAMYAVIATQKSPKVDTNRLYVTGLSWGGVAAFELPCSYPGRFAASVPTACIQSPMRIAKDCPGNYWMLYNENAYKSEWSQSAIREIERLVKAGHGDFRCSTFPDAGHDAWRKAWCEDAVWDWVFSKGVKPLVSHEDRARLKDDVSFSQIQQAKCRSSIPGMDDAHGPDKIVDGLDATYFMASVDAKRGDWVEVEFVEPVKGRFVVYSGTKDGSGLLANALVEVSNDGKRWKRVGMFSGKNGVARADLRSAAKLMRFVYTGAKPRPLVIRKIVKEAK